jgi:hypothetical protein
MDETEILRGLAQAPGFVTLFDTDGRILWTNKLVYGLTREVLGRPVDGLIADEYRDRWREWFRRAAHAREVVDYRVRVLVPREPGWATIAGRLGPVVRADEVRWVACVAYDTTFREELSVHARFLLGPEERVALAVLLDSREPLKTATVAKRSGRSNTGHFRDMLSALAGRGILTPSQAGYYVSDAFRPYALDLLRRTGADRELG